MNPISAIGFQLTTNGKFEARQLESAAEAPKLIISKDGTPKLAITPKTKLAIGGQAPALKAGALQTATPKAASAADGAPQTKVDPKLEKVAHEFESIFLRNLLKPLEEAGSMGKQSGASVSSGSGVYGSMMVGALADSASQGGGIGLAHLVLEALTRGAAGQKSAK